MKDLRRAAGYASLRAPADESQTCVNPKTPAAQIAAAVLVALGLGVFTASQVYAPRTRPQPESGVVLNQPRPLADFALVDHEGLPYTNAQLQGHWTLLFAGFTHCPDVCPTTLSLMKQLDTRLRQRQAPLDFLFLSVDPERDTPEQLKKYVTYFSPAIRGVSGTREQLDALCASLGIAYLKVPGAREGEYTVDHSTALVLLDPQGRVAGYFQPPHKLDTLAADLAGIVTSGT
jgi:protein SCO1